MAAPGTDSSKILEKQTRGVLLQNVLAITEKDKSVPQKG